MAQPSHRKDGAGVPSGRSVTIKDLAAELGLSITTISRALNGYSDVGEQTRDRVREAAQAMGYRPNRNAQRLVTQRTRNIAWVQTDNDRKFVDPHFVEVMAGVLRGARRGNYDVVLTSHTPEQELAVYDRYVNDNSVDGFVVDLPRKDDPRVAYLSRAGRPFVVHGRTGGAEPYGWVDIDNYGNFYRLARLLIANGHERIAFINGDEHFAYARFRRHGVRDAMTDGGPGARNLRVFNSLHPMGGAGFKLTLRALADPAVTAILYSSTLMAVEGHAAIVRSGRRIAVATMDDELNYLDLSPFADEFTYVRSSLRAAGAALVAELIRQCETGGAPRGTLLASTFHVAPDLDPRSLDAPIPPRERAMQSVC